MIKRISLLWSVIRRDGRQLWYALRHPAAPGWLKLGTAMLVVYVVSPIDVIPDFIPFLGVMDDIVLVPLAIRFLLDRLPPGIAEAVGRAPRDVS